MKTRLAIAALAVCLSVSPSIVWGAEDTPEKQPPGFAEMFSGDVHEQLTVAMFKMVDAYLDYVSRPETIAKLATFQKNYYEALIDKGFTEEQAFQLVRDFGNPMRGGSVGQK